MFLWKRIGLYYLMPCISKCFTDANVPLLGAHVIFSKLQNMGYRFTLSKGSVSTALLLIRGPFISNTACMSSPIVGSNLQ